MGYSIKDTRNGLRVEWGPGGIAELANAINSDPGRLPAAILALEVLDAAVRDADELIERLRSIAPTRRRRMTMAEWEELTARRPRHTAKARTEALAAHDRRTRLRDAEIQRRKGRGQNVSQIAAAMGLARDTVRRVLKVRSAITSG